MKTDLRQPLALMLAFLASGSVVLASGAERDVSRQNAGALKHNDSPLVEKVRGATAQFRNVNAATSEGWVPGTPCVSGPNSGAMGVHFVLPSRIDGVATPDEPEAYL